MADVCLKEKGITLAGTQVGLGAWVSRGYIIVSGVESTTQNGSLNFGKRRSK